jgi:hypothetical protein
VTDNALAQAFLEEIKRLAARFERVEGRMANIEGVVADLDGRVKSWPDMHYIGAAVKAQLAQTREMKADVADIKVRLDEIYQAMAIDPEIKNLRDEVSRFREQSPENEVRLGAIEGRIGIKDNVEPH